MLLKQAGGSFIKRKLLTKGLLSGALVILGTKTTFAAELALFSPSAGEGAEYCGMCLNP
jgi:hypothetical protein